MQSKLSKLRVLGSGENRKGGLGKGIDSRTVNPGGMKACSPGLDDVLTKEGLPASGPIPQGEQRHLERLGLSDLRAKLQEPKMRRKSKPSQKRTSTKADPVVT